MYQIIKNHASINGGTNNLKIVQVIKGVSVVESFSSIKLTFSQLEKKAVNWIKKQAGLKAPAKRQSAKSLCRKVVRVEGLKINGQLKKGYKYQNGKVVKATSTKKVKKK